MDPNHDIRWVVQVWIPFEPDAYKTGRVEYLEEELNQLHHEGEERGGGKTRLRKSEVLLNDHNRGKCRKADLRRILTDDRRARWTSGVMQNVNFEDREVATERRLDVETREILAKTTSRNVCSSTPVFDLTRVGPRSPPTPLILHTISILYFDRLFVSIQIRQRGRVISGQGDLGKHT
jgi:hypothetical protein